MEELNEYTVAVYEKSKKQEWDEFIDASINGTFLQSKRFLDYHPTDRFIDCSLMIYDKKNVLVALCPACCRYVDGAKVFYSHAGSTFGGIIITERSCHFNKIMGILLAVEDYCKKNGYSSLLLKQTSDLFSVEKNDLIEYCYYYLGYQEFKELNLYIDFSKYKENILSNFSQGKRTNINNCKKKGVTFKKLNERSEINTFYNILCQTLQKYNRLPVHNLDELLLLKDEILLNECEFYGAFLDDEMIAGSMMFYFNKAHVAHTQYLCALHEYDTLSAMTYMYYAMIDLAKSRGYKGISFGIATEDNGTVLNSGLLTSKEAFGSLHSLNRTYRKSLI